MVRFVKLIKLRLLPTGKKQKKCLLFVVIFVLIISNQIYYIWKFLMQVYHLHIRMKGNIHVLLLFFCNVSTVVFLSGLCYFPK